MFAFGAMHRAAQIQWHHDCQRSDSSRLQQPNLHCAVALLGPATDHVVWLKINLVTQRIKVFMEQWCIIDDFQHDLIGLEQRIHILKRFSCREAGRVVVSSRCLVKNRAQASRSGEGICCSSGMSPSTKSSRNRVSPFQMVNGV